MAIEQRYITLKEAAIYLSLSTKTLYEWTVLGKIPAYKLGRVWRFDRAELDTYVHKDSLYNPAVPSRGVAGLGIQKGRAA